MRKLILTLGLFLIGNPVFAQIVPFDYTGNYDEDFYLQGYLPGSKTYVGGSSGNDSSGYASQFVVSQESIMTSLVVDATVADFAGYPTTMQYQLYGPSLDSQALTETEDLVFDPEGQQYQEQLDVPMYYDLTSGTYWLAETGSGGEIVQTSQEYVDPSPVPEPDTVWPVLLGCLGLFCLWGRRGRELQPA